MVQFHPRMEGGETREMISLTDMEISKTDAATIVQLLDKMAAHICEHSGKSKDRDLARRASLMAKKMKKKIDNNSK